MIFQDWMLGSAVADLHWFGRRGCCFGLLELEAQCGRSKAVWKKTGDGDIIENILGISTVRNMSNDSKKCPFCLGSRALLGQPWYTGTMGST